MLTIVPQGGLCNRLRVVLSAIEASRRGVAPIQIHWGRDAECRAWFEELFLPISSATFRIVHRQWWAAPITRRNLHLPALLRRAMGYRLQQANCLPGNDEAFYRMARGAKVYLSGGYSLCSYSPQCLELLQPQPEIQRRVEALVARFSASTVGVHIRRTDNVKSMQHSTPDGFRRAMRKALAEDAETTFFLATDDALLKAELEQEFAPRVITCHNPVRRYTLEGMCDAVVDLWCLAATRRIIGSYWSSFTDTAAELRQLPLEIVEG